MFSGKMPRNQNAEPGFPCTAIAGRYYYHVILARWIILRVGSPAMELDASLSWLALALTPGLGSRLSARVLHKFGSPDGVFRASWRIWNPAIFPRKLRRPW